MYADCPNCRRQFVVRAQHLAAASGEVRCGFCGTQFNALRRLRDEPLRDLPPAAPEAVDEPQFEVPDERIAAPRIGAVAPRRREPVRPAEAVPPEWAAELAEEPPARGRRLWTAAAGVLLAAAALQIAWFHRDALWPRFPQLVPYATRWCERAGCRVIRHRDLAAIRILNRDVRLHPRFEKLLLVNATMANQSGELQPFPRVQLALYDTQGNALAYRAFAPEEYLDRSVDEQRGMLPGAPVHFVLEISGPTDNAVSFEFGFL